MTWLAPVLAERFQRVVPTGFIVVSSDAGPRRIYGPDHWLWAIEAFGKTPGDEEIERTVPGIASEIQDFIAEETATPWPGEKQMPTPSAAVRDAVLEVWYGDENDPILRLDPIEFA
jgi:hypothetical protein